MDNVEQTLLKRGLYRLGTARSHELASFSGAPGDAVDAYLGTRPDLVLPREPGGPWTLRRESRETLMAEIRAGIERDPERLSDYLQPGAIERVRSSLRTAEAILDDIASGAIEGDWLLGARLSHAGKAIGEMRRHGRDVATEEARLAACRARLAG